MKVKEEEKEELQKKNALSKQERVLGFFPFPQTTRVEILGIHKTVKFDVVGEQPATKYYPNQLKTD